MGKGKDITQAEKQHITQLLGEKVTTLAISKQLGRDHRTIKKCIQDITKKRSRTTGNGFKNLSARDKRQLKRAVAETPLLTSAQVFEKAGIGGVKRDKRCRILRELTSVKKSSRQPRISDANILKRLAWIKKYLKTDFSKVIFTDESRVTLIGWSRWMGKKMDSV